MLGLAVAALIAAWLPFSILYINSLSKQAATVVRASPVTQTGGVRAGQKVRSVAPITTHTSPAVP